MPKLDSELKTHPHSASFIGPVDSDRFMTVLLDDLVSDSLPVSFPHPEKPDPNSEADCRDDSPCLHTPGEMAHLLAPDLNGLRRWD